MGCRVAYHSRDAAHPGGRAARYGLLRERAHAAPPRRIRIPVIIVRSSSETWENVVEGARAWTVACPPPPMTSAMAPVLPGAAKGAR